MKIFTTILFWICISAYLVIALGFTGESKKGIICNEVCVIIEDSLKLRFFAIQDIEEIIHNAEIKTLGYPLKEINTRKLERLFHAEPFIKKVDIYTTMNGILAVRVIQREPVVRVVNTDGRSCYIDRKGYVMPENKKFPHYLLVANGYIPEFNKILESGNLNLVGDIESHSKYIDILKLANALFEDDFWKNQIVQIYINRQGIIELIPRVGAHQIILGDATGLEEKLENLRILYDNGLAYEGWNKYDKIDLRFKNQVVCTKR